MSDKRSVATDALETLGNLIEDGGRDAIHLAVEPIEAGETLYPGQHIGIVDGKAYTSGTKLLGIVDPFIKGFVPPGKKFWLIVYPRQITSLRHVWSHPDFLEGVTISSVVIPEKTEETSLGYTKAQSEQWLRNWCDGNDAISYDDLVAVMGGAGHVSKSDDYGNSWRNEGDYLLSYGFDSSGEIPIEVWVHLENVLGKKLQSYPSHFSCSC